MAKEDEKKFNSLKEAADHSYAAAAKYLDSGNLTKEDYISAQLGEIPDFDPSFPGYGVKEEVFIDSEFNTPENNDLILQKLIDKNRGGKYDSENHDNLAEYAIRMSKKYNISDKMINNLLTSDDYLISRYGIKDDNTHRIAHVLNNPNINTGHLYRAVSNNPSIANSIFDYFNYTDVPKDLIDKGLIKLIFDKNKELGGKVLSPPNVNSFLTNQGLNPFSSDPENFNLPNDISQQILEHYSPDIAEESFNELISSVDDSFREQFINKKLGIEGGGLENPDLVDLTENWNNWKRGDGYDDLVANRLAASSFLNEDQIEHIKRHGDFNSKYNLFHNEKIDPKHGKEMFWKWHNDQDEHGYDAEELRANYRALKDDVYTLDDLPEDAIDEEDLLETADENARERYEFYEWIYDNIDDIDLSGSDYPDDLEDKVIEDLIDEHDWVDKNPNFDQDYDSELQNIIDYVELNKDDDEVTEDDVIKATGKTARELKLEHLFGKGYSVDTDDIVNHGNDVNPEEIDFAGFDASEYSITDHPEYKERFDEKFDEARREHIRENPNDFYEDFYEEWESSEPYQNAWQVAMNYAKEEAARPHFQEMYESSHQDERFVPEHLREHIPELEQMATERKKLSGDGIYRPFLNEHIPQRDYVHQYGEGLHHHEMLKDYADINNGSIDIGKMNKKFPNLKDSWKNIFGNQGKLTSEQIEDKINNLPKANYNISYGKWKAHDTQNLNGKDQIVMRLDHSDESVLPLREDPELFQTFKTIQQDAKNSGHPVKNNTIAWARVDTSDPKHWIIDEVQSDFGSSLVRLLKQHDQGQKAEHVQKIADHHKDWRESLINHVIKLAKKHGAEKISTHSPESKSAHTRSDKIHSVYKDSYKKVPRKMGFESSEHHTLPLTDKGKRAFNTNQHSKEYLMINHEDAYRDHMQWKNWYSNPKNYIKDDNIDSEGNIIHTIDYPEEEHQSRQSAAQKLAEHHHDLAEKHKERLVGYGKNIEEIVLDDLEGYSEGDSWGKKRISEKIDDFRNEKHKADVTMSPSYAHHMDKALSKDPIDFDNQKFHEAHTLNLIPELPKIKKYFGLTMDLIKGGFKNTITPTPKKILKKENWKNKYKYFIKAEPDFLEPKKPTFKLPHIDPGENMVHSDYHGFGGAMLSDNQKELIHGIDMESGKPLSRENLSTFGSKIHNNVLSGAQSIVKPASGAYESKPEVQRSLGHLDTRGHNAARREVMFHNMANKFFDLGKYVPTTAGFTRGGEDYSAQKMVRAHSLHPNDYPNRSIPNTVHNQYKKSLNAHHETGDLHKLAIMDFIMGNHDRHRGNYMLGKDNNQFHLIDNGLAFDYNSKVRAAPIPRYVSDAEKHGYSKELHPEAINWLNSLSDGKAEQLWDDHGFKKDHPTVQGFLNRLHNMKQFAQHYGDKLSLTQLLEFAHPKKEKVSLTSQDKTEVNP